MHSNWHPSTIHMRQRVHFETTNGDTVKIGGGDYGWVIDKKGEAAQIVEDIKNGESVTREPEYEQRAFCGRCR